MLRTAAALAVAAASMLAGAAAPAVAAAEPGTHSHKVVLLGTAGGPTPKKLRAAPATAIVIDGEIYLVDCGNGVGRQLVAAGLPLRALRQIFVTHLHSDHAADLATLPVLAWAAGLESLLGIHGPRPLAKALRAGLKGLAFDLATRERDEGRAPLKGLLQVREVRGDGEVYRDAHVVVTAARALHPPIREAYAYRFDMPGFRVVVSGDTAPTPAIVRLAQDADVLVHEILWLPTAESVATWIGKPVDHPLVKHIMRSHTQAEDLGRIARDARVKRLVLTHFVPGDIPVDEAATLAAIRRSFDGEVVFGSDLQEID